MLKAMSGLFCQVMVYKSWELLYIKIYFFYYNTGDRKGAYLQNWHEAKVSDPIKTKTE